MTESATLEAAESVPSLREARGVRPARELSELLTARLRTVPPDRPYHISAVYKLEEDGTTDAEIIDVLMEFHGIKDFDVMRRIAAPKNNRLK